MPDLPIGASGSSGDLQPVIRVNDDISIGEDEIHWVFLRASGPGGQKVNKVSTAVQLRFDVAGSRSLPGEVKQRLAVLAGSRLTTEGVLVLRAGRRRTQKANRADALDRLVALVARAASPTKPRVPTRPTAASRQRRLDAKKRRGRIKRLRGQAGQ